MRAAGTSGWPRLAPSNRAGPSSSTKTGNGSSAMLVRICSQRAERFVLGDRRQPCRSLCGPNSRRQFSIADARCSAHETVAAIGAKNALRRQSSMSASRLSRRIASDGTTPWLIISARISIEPRAAERRLLDQRERVGEDVELSERPFDAADDARDAFARGTRHDHLEDDARPAGATAARRVPTTQSRRRCRPRARWRPFEARRSRALPAPTPMR